MTVAELLQRIGNRKKSSFSEQQKITWLNEIEAQVQEYLGIDPSEWVVYTTSAADKSKVLIAPAPHDVLYEDWLASKIDFANEDIEQYSNNQMQFFADYHEFKSYAMRKGLRNEDLPEKYSNVF